MSNLDLTISDIFHGDTPVLKIMKGDSKVWPTGDIAIVLVNASHATCSIGTSRIALHSAFNETLLPDTSCIMTNVSISMGGVDITSTAYDSSDGSLTIADVTGDIIITATAVEVITFEDANVKSICVSNWGGGIISGEITPAEASVVTTLADKFRGNSSITTFNELRYFTGISSLYRSGSATNPTGEFMSCTSLAQIQLPSVAFTNMGGAFRYCKFTEVNFSNVTGFANMNTTFHNCTSLTKVKLPGIEYTGGWTYTFRGCSKLETIEFDSTADFSSVTTFNETFNNCAKLTTITGTITGIKQSINVRWCSLTVESVLVLLNGLSNNPSSPMTITLRTAMKTTYEANADYNNAVSIVTSAAGGSWTIAWSN